MKFPTPSVYAVVILLLSITAAAQDLSALPPCSIPCFTNALPDSRCGLEDQKCQCTTGRAVITEHLIECLPGACSQSDIDKVFPVVAKICANYGVTLTSTPHVTATGTKTGDSGGVTITGHHTLTGTAAQGEGTRAAGAAGANIVGVAAGVAAMVFGL